MTKNRRFQNFVPGAAISLALILAAPALGAPAGDEYLPQAPSASGDGGGGGGGGGEGDTGSSASGQDAAAVSSGSGTAAGEGKDPTGPGSGSGDSVPVVEASSPEQESSGVLDTLLDPIVLLLVAGVLLVAVGMTLHRRHGENPDQDPDHGVRERAKVPPTPDGEIVAGSEPRP